MAKALSNDPRERVLATIAAGAGFGAVRARQRGGVRRGDKKHFGALKVLTASVTRYREDDAR